MSRSTKKGPYVDQNLIEKVDGMKASGEKRPIKTWARRSDISPDFVGFTCRSQWEKIYSGLCHRANGRAQAGRVRSNPIL